MLESIREHVKAAHALSASKDRVDYSDQVYSFAVSKITDLYETLYEPALCLILEGAKQTIIDGRTLELRPGDSVLISHHVPVHARVTDAPYLALILKIEMRVIRGLHAQMKHLGSKAERAYAVCATQADRALLQVIDRLLGILDDPVDAALLLDSVHQEMHLRLLQAPHAVMLRELAERDSGASAIARAIDHIRANYSNQVSIVDVASHVGMSESSFHQKFREVTGTTPLQYLKSLRLFEAHNMLLLDNITVTSAAFAVGYESPNHFSRDFSKRFGFPPKDARSHAG